MPNRIVSIVVLLAFAATALAACGGSRVEDGPGSTEPAVPVTDDGREDARTPGGLELAVSALPAELSPLAELFTKYVGVWGVHIVATATTDDAKLLHAANVMAQYLDNDADGVPDAPTVIDAMLANGAILLMARESAELESAGDVDAVFDFVGRGGQDLYANETVPTDGFDAALEEVHHLILNTGWASVYPERLAQAAGSAIAEAMDVAPGGHFESIPSPYPDGAWFTYDDATCDYTCMVTEYTYWGHTSLLGAQEGRKSEIGAEWKLETAENMRAGDRAAVAVLEDVALGLPTVLPDGNYSG